MAVAQLWIVRHRSHLTSNNTKQKAEYDDSIYFTGIIVWRPIGCHSSGQTQPTARGSDTLAALLPSAILLRVWWRVEQPLVVWSLSAQ